MTEILCFINQNIDEKPTLYTADSKSTTDLPILDTRSIIILGIMIMNLLWGEIISIE
ncbi:hypothetical protein [Riemerella columbipharyngis]|uniref:Uncharacterized protein n=1 Tax=Riemerella columbipharyngis TaxID=1071918 RepID=A0A1G6YLT8_9FLAO|nr:hypothetical protein SAMN05421544_101202 [Riemerella columbipharyngis]